MKKTCFTFALKYEETFSPTQYIFQFLQLHAKIFLVLETQF